MATSEPHRREAPPTLSLSLQTHSTFLLIGMTLGGLYGAYVAAFGFVRVNVVFTGVPSITPMETFVLLCFIAVVYAIVCGALALVVPLALCAVRRLFDRWFSESRLNALAALAVGFSGWFSFVAIFYVAPLFESELIHRSEFHAGLLSPAVNAGVAAIFLGIALIVFCTLRSENPFSRPDNKLPFILASATVCVCTGQSIYHVNYLLPDLMSTASLLGNMLFLGVQLTIGFVLFVVFKRALRPKGRWGQFSIWLALVLLVVSILVFLSSTAQAIAKDYAFKTGPLLVHTMLRTLVDVFDRDGDGYSAFSIVKDSVEGDPSINVFAIDIPNNGVDEDGVGGDLTTAALNEVKGVLGVATEKIQDEMIRQLVAEKKLNVIVIKLDGFRADRLPGRGYFRPVADGLKGLIDESVDCVRARTPSTGTSGAVTSVLTSMSPVSHRLSAAASPQQTKNIFGAKDALLGGADASGSSDLFALMRGAGFYTVVISNQGAENHNESPSHYAINEEIVPSSMPLGINVRRENRHYFSADEMRAIFEDKFESLEKSKLNLFFFIGFHEPHAPLDLKRGRQLLGKPGGRETAFSPSKLDGEFMAASYDANIEHVTEELTKLISYLRQKGEYSNSLIVVFSDHGEEFLEHGSVYHRSTLYRELTDVVLLFKFPREFGAGRKLERLTSLLDIAPTILDAVDVEIPVTLEGASILPLIRSHSSPVWRSYVRMDLLYRRDNIRFAVESDRHKYIYNFFNGTEELYDLREDPFEANNVVSQEGRTAKEMKLLLFNWKSYDELRSRGMWPMK